MQIHNLRVRSAGFLKCLGAGIMPSSTKRQREDRVLLAEIVYELRKDGIRTGKNRVWRLMKQHGLRVKTTKRFKRYNEFGA